MRICVLNSSYQHSNSPFAGLDPATSPARYGPQHHWHHAGIDKAKAVAQLRALVRDGLGGEPFDVFVNLCDGAWDEDRAGIEVVQTLERLNQPFTGADADFYEPSRETMKRACHYAGIRQPGWCMARGPEDVVRAARQLRFPLIVKHPSSYGSIGMTRQSRCETVGELEAAVERAVAAYGSALVEEFIEGREFTVLVAEAPEGSSAPRTWPPVEFRFPPGETFKHFDLKWVDHGGMSVHGVGDRALAQRLETTSAQLFTALQGTGYGRCDLRMDASGAIYTLEINPNCGIFYPPDEQGSADFILSQAPGGPEAFLTHILATALERHRRRQKAFEVVFDPQSGYGLVAARDLGPGEVVQPGEGRPHYLVTRPHVERHWDPQMRKWFRQYAWPLTGSVHVMWAERPEDWQPINHSCDPNCWLEGLDLLARRPIARGQALTVDYATFCGPEMEPFDCACGAVVGGLSACRGTISAADSQRSEVLSRYGNHASDYVRRGGMGAPISREIDLDPRVRIEDGGTLRSLLATTPLHAGERLSALRTWRVQDRPGRYTLQISATEHAQLEPYWLTWINHSCAPNLELDLQAGEVRVTRDVAAGQSLTCFYPATEVELAEAFACQCGAPGCLGLIRGARHLSPQSLSRYSLSRHVLDTLAGATA